MNPKNYQFQDLLIEIFHKPIKHNLVEAII